MVSYTYREDNSKASIQREVIQSRNGVAVVVFDPKLQKLVMIRQFRLGAALGTGLGMTVEIVAGMIDDGEEPIEAAKRELKEETGLSAIHMVSMCEFLTTPGLTSEIVHIFYAETDASELIQAAGVESESEQTFPFLLTIEEAMQAVDQNDIHNGIVMLGLLWFARHQTKILEQQT